MIENQQAKLYIQENKSKLTEAFSKMPVEISYKQLCNQEFLEYSYHLLKSYNKAGNEWTIRSKWQNNKLDGISKDLIKRTVENLKNRSLKLKPVTRVLIPKTERNGRRKTRPLGIPSPRDKIVLQAFKIILEAKYESIFLETSHGFRPNRSPHTAIGDVKKWHGITWIIQGVLHSLFDSLNHHKLAHFMEKEIKDKNLLDLYWKMVKAGYVSEEGVIKRNNIGVPQGGIIGPILTNIYLHEFDKFMAHLCEKFNCRNCRALYKNSMTLRSPSTRLHKQAQHNPLDNKDNNLQRKTPCTLWDTSWSRYSIPATRYRVWYNRYGHDWIVGICAPKETVVQIKEEIKQFLSTELDLLINEDNLTTKMAHCASQKAFYLGFEIGSTSRLYTQRRKSPSSRRNGLFPRHDATRVNLYAPIDKLVEKLIHHKFAIRKDKPCAITKWIYLEPHQIIFRYNSLLRGLLHYYKMVVNLNLFTHIVWLVKFSATFTLSRKWRLSPSQVFRKLGKNLTVEFNDHVGHPRRAKPRTVSLQSLTTLKRYPSCYAILDTTISRTLWDPFVVNFYDSRFPFGTFFSNNASALRGTRKK